MNDSSTNDDFLRDLLDYTCVLESLPGASSDHIAVGGLSNNPPVAELLERIGDVTRRDILDGGAAGLPQEGAMPGGEPKDGVSQEVVLERQEQAISPAGASLRTPQAGHSRFNSGDIRVKRRLLRLRGPALQHNRLRGVTFTTVQILLT